MSPFAKFMIRHLAFGALAGAVFVALLLTLNVGGLRDLIVHADNGRVVTFWLTALVSSTFASAQVGFAIIYVRNNDNDA